jgi:hypothetical protein
MSKETRRQFRRNSKFIASKAKDLKGGGGFLAIQHAHQQQSIHRIIDHSDDEEEEGAYTAQGWMLRNRESAVYSDSDTDSSSDSDNDSDCSDEFADRKKEIQEKLRVTQRRFATLFAENAVDVPVVSEKETTQDDENLRRGNALIPPPMEEEDFRNRRKGRVRHENYFGVEAKTSFLNRYHWVSHEQSVLDHGVDDLQRHTVFEENTFENSHTIEYPFMPRRPVNPDDASVASEDLYENDNISQLLCEDFEDPVDNGSGVDLEKSVAGSHETHSVATLDLSATMQFNKQTETTPRTKFIAACIKAKIHPRASLLLRKNVSTELNLQHQGMMRFNMNLYLSSHTFPVRCFKGWATEWLPY